MPGNRVLIAIPKLVTGSVAERDREGLGAYDLGFQLTRDAAGDDELRIYIA